MSVEDPTGSSDEDGQKDFSLTESVTPRCTLVSAMDSLSTEVHVKPGEMVPILPLHFEPMSSLVTHGIYEKENEEQVYMTQEKFDKVLEVRRDEIRRTVLLMKSASKVDICFMIDCTGSMQPWIDGVKSSIAKFTSQLQRCYPDCELRFAFVGYTDYDQEEEERTKVLDFTGEYRRLYDFMDTVKAPEGVGGDPAEDVIGGLNAVISLNWRPDGTKALIHVTDCPCHGTKFHDNCVRDSYPEGDPGHTSHHDIMERIAELKIQYWFGHIKKQLTDKMIEVFSKSLLKFSDRESAIRQFDAWDPSLLEILLSTSTLASIGCTVDTQLGKKPPVRKFNLATKCPDFNSFPIRHGKKTRSRAERISGDDVFLEPPSVHVSLKCASDVFATGSLRLAFHAYNETKKKRVVLKVFKRSGQHWNSPKRYMEVAEMEKLATSYAEDFNREKPHDVEELSFLTIDIVDFGKDQKPDSRWYTMEEYIDGVFQKFNNNTGWVSYHTDPMSAAMQAFSHFTWVRSGKKLLICDLQGWKRNEHMLLTDPSIHSQEYWRFGRTNLGPVGIRKFFETHKCNEICMKMQLEPKPMDRN